MRYTRTLALLALVAVTAGCARGGAPTTAAPDTAVSAPQVNTPPPTTQEAPKATKAQPPVRSLDRAFALVLQTREAQEIRQRLGARLTMVNMKTTPEFYAISLGENQPDRVRFEAHFTVAVADGIVRYTDPLSGAEKLATPITYPPDPAVQQAEALLGKGDVATAIALLETATAERPSPDAWNLLSHAHLQKSAWQAARTAGLKALELDAYHPFALFNTAQAELALQEYAAAISHLRNDLEVQPDRVEPYLGLARAYQGLGQQALAADAVAEAQKVAPAEPTVEQGRKVVAGMVRRTAPTDLTTAAKIRLEDGPYAIFLSPEKPHAVVYLKGPDGVQGLPIGEFRPESWSRFTRVDVGGGAVGYFLAGESVGAYVANSLAFRLFVRTADGAFRQIVFTANTAPAFVPPVADFLRSGGVPHLQGDRLIATYSDDASGKTPIQETWQLRLAEGTAVMIEKTRAPNK